MPHPKELITEPFCNSFYIIKIKIKELNNVLDFYSWVLKIMLNGQTLKEINST